LVENPEKKRKQMEMEIQRKNLNHLIPGVQKMKEREPDNGFGEYH